MRVLDVVQHLQVYSIRRAHGLPALYFEKVESSRELDSFSEIVRGSYATTEGKYMYIGFRVDESDLSYKFLRDLRKKIVIATYPMEVNYESTRRRSTDQY